VIVVDNLGAPVSPDAFEPNPRADSSPDIWGFRHTPDGRYAYMTSEDLEQATAKLPPMSDSEMFAQLGAMKTLGDRAADTLDRLDALRRLREAGLLNDAQSELIVTRLYQGR
jgi:hypothetical protein